MKKDLYKSKSDNHLVEIDDIRTGRLCDFYVTYHQQGGGFSGGCSMKTFMRDFEPVYTMPMAKVKVCGDWMDPGTYYEAWSDGTRWNGWVIPYFERDAVQAMSEDGVTLIAFVHGKVVIERDEVADVVIAPKVIETPEGPKQVWQVDDGWCWEIYEPEEGEQ